jgi:hypothetical protein
MPTWLFSVLLLLLTRDGTLHRFDGHHDTTAKVVGATAIAALGSRVAVAAGNRILVDGRAVPGRYAGVRALAAGTSLWALTVAGASRVDVDYGGLTLELVDPRAHLIAADGDAAFVESDGTIVQVGGGRNYKVPGRPIALAAGDGKLWVATREGPLFELDRASGTRRELGLGDWWGTVGLAYADHAIYAVTVAGKLWRIDPVKREKTIVAMDGWQGAVDLSVLR